MAQLHSDASSVPLYSLQQLFKDIWFKDVLTAIGKITYIISPPKATDVLPTFKALDFIPINQHLWHSWLLDVFSVKIKKKSWFLQLGSTSSVKFIICWYSGRSRKICPHLWWQKSTFPWFQISQEWLRCLNTNSPWAHVLALTGKRKDSSNPGLFVQSLFLLVTGIKKKKKSRNTWFHVTITEFTAGQLEQKKLTQKCFSLERKWLNNPSIHYKPGSVSFSPIRSSVFSRAVAATQPLPPQGSPASSLGWAAGATIHQRRQMGNSRRGRAEEKQSLQAHRKWQPQAFLCSLRCVKSNLQSIIAYKAQKNTQ